MTDEEIIKKAWEIARANTDEKIKIALRMAKSARLAQEAAAVAQTEQEAARAAMIAPRSPDARAYVLTITLRVNGTVEVVPSREGHLVSLRRVCDSVADAENYARILTAGLTEGRNDVSVIKVYL